MKSIITSVLILSVSLLKAQSNAATPNAGFEAWTHFTSTIAYDDPNNWQCLNPSTAIIGSATCVKDSTNPHSGKYDVQLITESVFTQTAPGALTTGTINTTNKTINGGLPYTLHPDTVIGWYHYISVSGDNGDIEFYLFGTTHADTIGKVFFHTPTSTVSNWTRFSLPVTYLNNHTIDTALWIFSSSINQAGAKVGSQLFVDDLGLVIDSTTGIKNITNSELISVGPNPTPGLISIRNTSNSASLIFTLVDVTGRKIEENKLTVGTNNMELTGVADGIYLYTIVDGQNAVIKTGKIVVRK